MGNVRSFIMGFDILPSHSPRSKKRPKFSCVLMREGSVFSEYPEVSRGKLLNLVREFKPKWLCTDNIFEIVPDSKSLFRFVNRLPIETRIVQVTGVPPHQTALKILARRHDIPIRGKPSPLQSAQIAAQLASKGVGHVLECFGEQTEIKVTRGRKLGRGGQSANRYRRRMHSRIQQMTRHIESELKMADIRFDIHVRESDFGYSSARIVAYAPLPAIRDLIESKRGGDFNVRISPVRKRVEFLPLEPKPVPTEIRPRYFILGVDPGTTAAICLLSLRGKVQYLKSKKMLTRADIIRMVYDQGIPVLVASDVPNAPRLVEKIASTINADIYTPRKPIPVALKNEISREYSEQIRIRNAHERDALTAAVYAYRSILPKLEQIDKRIRDEQLTIDRNHLKALVIKGMSINEAIASLTHEESEVVEIEQEPAVPEEPELTPEKYHQLTEEIHSLKSDNDVLGAEIEDLKRLVEYQKFRESELSRSLEIVRRDNYWRVKRDREVAKKGKQLKRMKSDNRRLRKQIHKLKKRLKTLRGVKRREIKGDMIAVKVISHFTREDIEEYLKKVGLKSGDIILFEDASGGGPQTAEILIERGIRAVIVDTPLSHLAKDALVKAVVPVINADEVELQRIDEFAFINRKRFESQLEAFLKVAREKARQKGEEQLIELVERYRREIER